tara:strand:- start:40 stop:687 length:648 start_codon:yes stop_codon:yes gene_type:complete
MTINFRKRILTALILLFLTFLMINFNFVAIYIIIIFGVLSTIEYFQISRRIFKTNFFKYLVNTLFLIFLSLFCSFFYYFINFIHLKIILYILIFGCIASDTGGFIFGKLLKGPKLTKISPNKTYSGAIGSVLCTCLIVSSSIFYLTNNFSYIILLIAVFTSLSCQLGDLFFSFMKRKAKIKDTGNILPGHGGILDRLDGILFGVPIGFISLILLS